MPHSFSATSAGGLAIWKRICPQNVKPLVHPESQERQENSEKLQGYPELDGCLSSFEVYEWFKSPKSF